MVNENEVWQVMVEGNVYEADTNLVNQWISEGRLQPTDQIKKGSLSWTAINKVPAFREKFNAMPPNNNQMPPTGQDYNYQKQAYNYQNPAGANQAQTNAQPLPDYINDIRSQQNLAYGISAGLIASFVSAFLWALITAFTGYKIGWMSVGVGFLVGFAVRTFGKGIDTIYGVVGGSLSLLGCMIGNVLAVCIVASSALGVPVIAMLSKMNLGLAIKLLRLDFGPLDILFYGIAIYEGYKFSFRSDNVDKGAS